jgi:hypothetical protein
MPKPRGKQRWITYLSQKNCDQLGFPEWFDITGLGLKPFGLYEITLTGVRFHGYSNSEIDAAPIRDQAFMVRANENLPLTFPFTLQALLDFVDGPDGQIGGRHFSLPKGFREAAAMLLKPVTDIPDEDKSQKFAVDAVTKDESPKDWISKAQDKAQELGMAKWKMGIRQITARGMCEAVSTALADDQTTWGMQGQRSSSSVRNEGLRGWKFKPPIEGKTVD